MVNRNRRLPTPVILRIVQPQTHSQRQDWGCVWPKIKGCRPTASVYLRHDWKLSEWRLTLADRRLPTPGILRIVQPRTHSQRQDWGCVWPKIKGCRPSASVCLRHDCKLSEWRFSVMLCMLRSCIRLSASSRRLVIETAIADLIPWQFFQEPSSSDSTHPKFLNFTHIFYQLSVSTSETYF